MDIIDPRRATACGASVDSPPQAAEPMRPLWLTLLAYLFAYVQSLDTASIVAQIPKKDGVLVLTEQTFAAAMQTYRPLFVLLDSSARFGSLTLFRRFADAAQAVQLYDWNMSATVRMASLDVSQLTHTLPYQLKVLGLPALLLFRCSANVSSSDEALYLNSTLSSCPLFDGGVEVYTGGRTSMEFQRYVLGQPLRQAVRVQTRAELYALTKTRPFVALFVVDGDDSQAYFDCRVLAQLDTDSSTYAVTTNLFIFEQKFGSVDGDVDMLVLTRIPSLVVFREFGTQRTVYVGDWNKAALVQFIQKNRYNLISTYMSSDASYFFDRAADAHVLLFSDSSKRYHRSLLAGTEDIAHQFYAAANNPGGYVFRFIVIPKNEETLKDALFVADAHFPTVLLVRDVAQPPLRFPFYGESCIALLKNGSFSQALSDEIAKRFPPFSTSDLPGDDIEPVEDPTKWRDYSDLFENRKVPVMLFSVMQTFSVASVSSALSTHSTHRRLVDSTSADDNTDFYLSLFTAQRAESEASLDVIQITDYGQLQDLWQRDTQRVLAVLHSPRCYSCRQAMEVLHALPPVAAIHTLAIVNVDRVDVRDWPLRTKWLPGIFVVSADGRIAAYPSRTAVTVDSMIDFLLKG